MNIAAVLCVVLTAAMLAGGAGAVLAQTADLDDPQPLPRAEPVKKLRLMLLDLSDFREKKSDDTFEPPPRGYSHTFGSQRKSTEEPEPLSLNPESVEADVVLLHGVVEPRAARRLFPARDWRLLMARGAADRTGGKQDTRQARPDVAVALWLQAGVRFGGGDPSLPPGLGAALRVTSGLGTLWALSPSEPCTTSAAADAICKPLEDWIAAKLTAGDIVVVGGVLPAIRRIDSKAAPVIAAPIPEKLAHNKATAMLPRRGAGVVQLTGADTAGRCGGDARTAPTLHLRLAKDDPPAVTWAGYVVPLEPPKPSANSGRPEAAARPPACALVLDIEAAR